MTGVGHCFASGRLSYVHGLQGACEAFDTACSSALVACHAGCRAVRLGECTHGLLAGVNMMFLPWSLDAYASAGLTSSVGRAFVFDRRADGFVRGEGCGAAKLNEESGNQASLSLFAAVRGSAVRQDGRSASLTAPNGQAQKLLLDAVLADACMPASVLPLLEAAANGSELGDPIEAGAVASAILRLPREDALLAGSIKANVGHTESASGIAGLSRMLDTLKQARMAPNAQLAVLATPVAAAFQRSLTSIGLLRQLAAVPSTGGFGTTSSFGLGGTIASAVPHVLLATSGHREDAHTLLTFRRRYFPWQTATTIHFDWRGAISAIELREQFAFASPIRATEAECQVRAVGLNFRDVLLVLDQCPGSTDEEPPGADCAGVVCAVGDQVRRLHRGLEVFGISPGCLMSLVRSRGDARLLTRRPVHVAAPAACSLPITWSTAYEAVRRGGVRCGRPFLIHAAAGGVGLMAIEMLNWLAAPVMGTAGSVGKVQMLRGASVRTLCSSRDALASAYGSATQLSSSRMCGICNSLTGDFSPLALATLKEGAPLQEIGKRAAWSNVRIVASSFARLSLIDLANDVQQDVEWFCAMLGRLKQRLMARITSGLPVTEFGLHEARDAFELLKSGGNVGKVVLCSPFSGVVDVDLLQPSDRGSTPGSWPQMKPVLALTGVVEIAQHIAHGTVDADSPLMDAGINSLGAIELRNRLQRIIGKPLPGTIMFSHPTARQLTVALSCEAKVETTPKHLSLQGLAVGPCGGHRKLDNQNLCGTSSALPFGVQTVSGVSHLTQSGADLVGQVPSTRWVIEPTAQRVGAAKQRVRYGAFVYGTQLIDNAMFLISPAETCAMDPQQRLLLTHGYGALHSSNDLRRAEIFESPIGVFLAIASTDFAQMQIALPGSNSVYGATGAALSVASGRMSYVLGLHGPCVSYDTACSAALAACHAARSALRLQECPVGLVSGVTLMLTPVVGALFAVAGMTSSHGRSFTFDARADGFARGEACGALVLGPRSAAAATHSTHALSAVGSAVRQDGRTASLTAPSGQAQQMLYRAALSDAALVPNDLGLHEAHGTGTALGDPIEASSIADGFLTARTEASGAPLPICGIKANVAHGEPAAGMSGLLATVCGLHGRTASPNAQLRVLNLHVAGAFAGLACTMLSQATASADVLQTVGGVSSFGFSGTIGHLVLKRPMTHHSGTCRIVLYSRRRTFFWGARACSCGNNPATYRISWILCDAVFTMEVFRIHLLAHANCYSDMQVLTPSSVATPLELWCAIGNLTRYVSASARAVCLMHAVNQMASRHSPCSRLLFFTTCTFADCMPLIPDISPAGTAHAGSWGFARALRQEQPCLQTSTTKIGNANFKVSGLCVIDRLLASTAEREQAWQGGDYFGARLRMCSISGVVASESVSNCSGRSFAITGGLGGLGIRAGIVLLSQEATFVTLASRSGSACHDCEIRDNISNHNFLITACDVSSSAEVLQMLHTTVAPSMCPADGILHASGAVRDGMALATAWADASLVFASKSDAASHIDASTQTRLLHACMLFSSIVSAIGNLGQTNYASANAYMDGLAASRFGAARIALSMQWPLVTGAGMGHATLQALDSSRASSAIHASISLDDYAGILSGHIHMPKAHIKVAMAIPSSVWELEKWLSSSTCLCQELARAVQTASYVQSDTFGRPAPLSLSAVLKLTHSALGSAITADASMIEAGLDSIGVMAMRDNLQKAAGQSIVLPYTLIFDHPSARMLANFALPMMSSTVPIDTPLENATEDDAIFHASDASSFHTNADQSHVHSFIAPRMLDAPHEPNPIQQNHARRIRLLMLHGDAGDSSLVHLMLQVTGWSTAADFVCINAPHACSPKPHLYEGLQDRHYSKPQYRSWGLHDGRMTAESVEHVQRCFKQEQCVGLAGMCDGAIIASLAAMQTPEVQVFLNFCGGPLSMVDKYVRSRPQLLVAKVDCPSLHLLSFQDKLFNYEQLSSVPSRCADPLVQHHRQGHVIPLMTAEMRQSLLELAKLTDSDVDALRVDGSERPLDGQIRAQELTEVPQRDSMDLLARLADNETTMSAVECARGHVDFLVTVIVIWHHSRLRALTQKLGILMQFDREVFMVMQAVSICAMPTAIVVLGAEARASEKRLLIPRLMSIVFVLWAFTLSGLPIAFSNYIRSRIEVGAEQAKYRMAGTMKNEYWYAAERLTTPLWFLIALFIWESLAAAARCLHATKQMAVASLMVHVICYSKNCRWPLWRDGAFGELHFESTMLKPLNGYLVPTGLSRAASYWWLYAAVPYILPQSFPAQLPGERLLGGRVPTLVRMGWVWASGYLMWILARDLIETAGANPTTGPLQNMVNHGLLSYGCTNVRRGQCAKHSEVLWSFSSILLDIKGCLMLLMLAVGVCAAAPRRASPFARAGQASLIILCTHEYVLAVLDSVIGHLVSIVSQSFGCSPSILVVLSCALISMCIAHASKTASSIIQLLSGLLPATPRWWKLIMDKAEEVLLSTIAMVVSQRAFSQLQSMLMKPPEREQLLDGDGRAASPESLSLRWLAIQFGLPTVRHVRRLLVAALLVAVAVRALEHASATVTAGHTNQQSVMIAHGAADSNRTYGHNQHALTTRTPSMGTSMGVKKEWIVRRPRPSDTTNKNSGAVSIPISRLECATRCTTGVLSSQRTFFPDASTSMLVKWCCPSGCQVCGGNATLKCDGKGVLPRWCCPFSYGRVDGKIKLKSLPHLNVCINSTSEACLVPARNSSTAPLCDNKDRTPQSSTGKVKAKGKGKIKGKSDGSQS